MKKTVKKITLIFPLILCFLLTSAMPRGKEIFKIQKKGKFYDLDYTVTRAVLFIHEKIDEYLRYINRIVQQKLFFSQIQKGVS